MSVIDSSPSNGPAMASPAASSRARSFAAVPGTSILKYRTRPSSRASRARSETDSVTPLSGASWTMIGTDTASATRAKNS